MSRGVSHSPLLMMPATRPTPWRALMPANAWPLPSRPPRTCGSALVGTPLLSRQRAAAGPPLFVASGAWEDLAPLIGSLGSEIPLDSCSSDAACPRDYGARVGGFMLRPGETAEDLRARAILGRLHGCIHSASGPSFYEAAAWPRADAPVCAAPARQGSTFALDVEYGATPPMDELIFQAGVEVQAGEGQLRIQPSEPGSPFVSLVLTGGGDRAFPVLAEPTSMRLHIESGSWSRAIALELRDAQGLALLAVRSSPHWTPEWTDGVRWNVEPATCLVPAGQDSLSPGMPQQGHRVTLVDGASSATWAEDTQVLNLAGVGYSMDVAAAHSWEATCADDDPGGLLDFLVMRQ
jgi:hypothetical protein